MLLGLKCQNNTGTYVTSCDSQNCRYILSKWCWFAKSLHPIAEVFRMEKMNSTGKSSETSSQDKCQFLDILIPDVEITIVISSFCSIHRSLR